jgi:NADH-quinone oxidoreductase subunit N
MNWFAIALSMLPEHLLLVGIVILTLRALLKPPDAPASLAPAIASVTLAALAALYQWSIGFSYAPFPGHFSVDSTSLAAKAIVLVLTLLVLLMARSETRERAFPILLLSSLYGVCLLFSADSFLTLFLGIELMSLPVYSLVLLSLGRPESPEGALKYLVLSGTASATLLMGVSLLYGASGTLSISAFADALWAADAMGSAAVVLIVTAFFLKAAVVPFHTWAPDAYEGAAVPVTAYMATIVKAGVILAAVRLFALAPVERPMADLLAVLPLASIIWGNLAAMRQRSFRRMMAYSSIAHAGYLFYALLGEGPGRFQAVAFYILAYGLTNLLAFASLPTSDNDPARDNLDNLKGLFQRQPFAALMIALAMLSLAGIPPLPGFVAKFLIFKNVIAAGFTLYGVLGLVASYLGIYFYLRVIQYLFMSTESPGVVLGPLERLARSASLLCLLAVMLLSVFPGWVIEQL